MFGNQTFVINFFSYCLDGPFGTGFNLWPNGSSTTIFSQVKYNIYLCFLVSHFSFHVKKLLFLIQSSRCWTSSHFITMECQSSRNNFSMHNIWTWIFHGLYEKFHQKIIIFGSLHDSSISELIPCAFCKKICIVNAV